VERARRIWTSQKKRIENRIGKKKCCCLFYSWNKWRLLRARRQISRAWKREGAIFARRVEGEYAFICKRQRRHVEEVAKVRGGDAGTWLEYLFFEKTKQKDAE